jgi:threonine/homoserine/homoserine lactone efflux protein
MDGIGVCVVALGLGFAGSMPLAGPIAVMTLSRAASQRFHEAIRIGLGAAAAEAIYAGVAFWGFSTFLARSPLLLPISHGATAALLMALGTSFLFWRPSEKADPHEKKAGTVLLGFTISALNPTLLVTWTAVAAFLHAQSLERTSALVAIPFGASAGAGVAAWFVCLVGLLRRFGAKISMRTFRWVIRAMGVALIVLGVMSAIRLVRWIARPESRTVSAAGCSFWPASRRT